MTFLSSILALLLLASGTSLYAQEQNQDQAPEHAKAGVKVQVEDPAAPAAQPLPDIPTLMRQVEVRQRQAEAIEKDYLYHEDSTFNEVKGDGSPKKTDERAFEIYWLQGVRVARMVRKDNKDLTPDELKKEDERIDKEVAKAKEKREKADAGGKETDSQGHDEITLSRILELGSFTNPRRQLVNGRPTILVDYTGDPNAKTHNAGEAALKVLTGTVWVDEQDKAVTHLEAHFFDNFKLGAGLVASIRKDTAFAFSNALINNEVWLPATLDAHGQARYLLFFSLNGDAHIVTSGYRKFKATSTLLPNFSPAPPDDPAPNSPSPPQ